MNTSPRFTWDQINKALDRLIERIEKTAGPLDTPCWIWTGCLNERGYGRIKIDNRVRKVHHVTYWIEKGDWDEETLDHRCRVRECCNPDHLEPVSHVENLRRGVAARQLAKVAA